MLAVAHATCASAGDEIGMDDEGRPIQLDQDGTWSLLSSDRFATNEACEQTDITVTTLGSPQWFGVKYLSLELAEGSIASLPRTVLRKDMDDVVRPDVKDFQ